MRTTRPLAILGASVTLFAWLSTPVTAQDEETSAPKVYSGPQRGEPLPPFEVTRVWDDEKGKTVKIEPSKIDAQKPVLLIFVHKVTRPSHRLVRMLTEYAREKKPEKLGTEVVWLQADRSEAMDYLQRARRSLNLRVPVGVSVDGAEGPGSYGLNRKVTLTVLVGRDGEVAANFALIQPNDTDAPRIAAAVARLLGEQAPSAQDLARRVDRGRRGGRMQREDPRLAQLLRAVIQKDADAKTTAEAIARVEEYTSKNPAARRRLLDIARRVVSGRIFEEGGYGNDTAREQLKKWAEIRMQEDDSPPERRQDSEEEGDAPEKEKDAREGEESKESRATCRA